MSGPRLAGPQPPVPIPEIGPYGGPLPERRDPGSRLRGWALSGLRHFGSATASLRCDPDYLIIGTKRGGSTSLARWLLDHPSVMPLFPRRETRKGTYFFDVNYARGHRWYRSHFPTRLEKGRRVRHLGPPQLIGEAVPYYLHHPHAPVRARATVPAAKVIALLRNPVDRAFGHWGERTRNGVEWLPFEAAIDAEPARLAGEEARMLADPSYTSFAHQHFSYVDQGRYERGLRRWMDLWPARQLLVLRSEDLYAEPAAVFDEVLAFLGLPPFEPAAFGAWNAQATSSMGPDMRARLRSELDTSITAVEELLGRSMGWDS